MATVPDEFVRADVPAGIAIAPQRLLGARLGEEQDGEENVRKRGPPGGHIVFYRPHWGIVEDRAERIVHRRDAENAEETKGWRRGALFSSASQRLGGDPGMSLRISRFHLSRQERCGITMRQPASIEDISSTSRPAALAPIWDLRRGDHDDNRTSPKGRSFRSLILSAALEFSYLKALAGFLMLIVIPVLLLGIAPSLVYTYGRLKWQAGTVAGYSPAA